MAEPIRLPGCPQVIVPRSFAWKFLLDCGMDPKIRGFGSIDYMVMHQASSSEPMSDLEALAPFLNDVIRRERAA